ncbi:MAG: ABC transporter permease [Oscillospiraceae bacterium]|nr:ABC transporter permease [Oscillospiraceae bacterium]
MNKIIIGEMYKQLKKKSIIVIALVAVIPFAFSFLIYSEPSFLEMDGEFGYLSYMVVMWQSMWSMFIPHILVVYLIACITEDETQGQILYELSRIPNRGSLVLGRLLSILIMVGGYIALFFVSATAGFWVFIARTEHYNPSDAISHEEIVQLWIGFLLLLLVVSLIYSISSKVKPIITLVIIIVGHFLLSNISYIENWKLIPGTLAYNMEYTVGGGNMSPIIAYQSVVLVALIALCLAVKQIYYKHMEVTF